MKPFLPQVARLINAGHMASTMSNETTTDKAARALCAYCGIRKGTTRDHVVPRSLFPKPLPKFMVTVPACSACNAEKKCHDDYLRDYLTLDAEGSNHPTAQTIFNGQVKRAITRNRSELGRSLIRNIQYGPRFTKQGIYRGHYHSFPIDGQRLIGAFSFIVRGLYYYKQRQRLPDSYQFEVARIEPWGILEILDALGQIGANGAYGLGDHGEFLCSFLYLAENPYVTYWLLNFYGSVFVTVSTSPPESSLLVPA